MRFKALLAVKDSENISTNLVELEESDLMPATSLSPSTTRPSTTKTGWLSLGARRSTGHFHLPGHRSIRAGCKQFEIYCLRHSALTMLAESGCDAFTLARIAGHSAITITQRYCHPQADAIERAFGNLPGGHKIGHSQELPAKNESGQLAADCAQIF
jgi:hypothetical protein